MNIEISRVEKNGKLQIILNSPYHPALPKRARELGGKWDGDYWIFDARDEERVRNMVRDIFGTDGTDNPELVTVQVNMDIFPSDHTIWFVGRQIASRASRDARVRLGEGVVVVRGGFLSWGGSRKYPTVSPEEGTTLEIRDVPRVLAEKAKQKYPHDVEILEDCAQPKQTAEDLKAGKEGPMDHFGWMEANVNQIRALVHERNQLAKYIEVLEQVAECAKPFAKHGGHADPEVAKNDILELRAALKKLEEIKSEHDPGGTSNDD